MARGKYAAKANGQRAESAANTVIALRGQLADERREHTNEVAVLKAEIATLQGRLLREVRDMAAAEVERVRAEGRAAVESERTQTRERMMKVAVLLKREVRDGSAWWADLADLLGMRVGEIVPPNMTGGTREDRRTTSASIRAAAHLEGAVARGDVWWKSTGGAE